MTPGKVKHLNPPPAYYFEAGVAFVRATKGRLRRWCRQHWFYRLFLRGQLCDNIAASPPDGTPHRLDEASALLRGRFTFAGETVEATGVSIFDCAAPSDAWREALHTFAWLPPLSVAGGEPARKLATELIAQWIRRYPHYSAPVYQPALIARRLLRLFSHVRFVVTNSDLMWRSRLFVSMREQTKLLIRTMDEVPDGVPLIEAAAALTLSGLALDDHAGPRRMEMGLGLLEAELMRQILPDGGHISRSPQDLVDAYRLIVMVMGAIAAKGWPPPEFLAAAQARMAPMIRFFRHGDGALAAFNGGAQGDAGLIAWLLTFDETRGKPPVQPPQSGYCRLTAGHTLALFDCGKLPPAVYSTRAHAAPLAFELSSGSHRIVVNCGAPCGAPYQGWDDPLRATAAHSAATLADMSCAMILPAGWMRRYLGPRMYRGPRNVMVTRSEDARGWTAKAAHDSYVETFGVQVERSLILSPQGLALSGADCFFPMRRIDQPVPFAIRFHIHPDVRVSRAQSGAVLLKLPNGEGWRFRAGIPVTVEESIYFGETARRTEQLVLNGVVQDSAVEVLWVFEQIGAA